MRPSFVSDLNTSSYSEIATDVSGDLSDTGLVRNDDDSVLDPLAKVSTPVRTEVSPKPCLKDPAEPGYSNIFSHTKSVLNPMAKPYTPSKYSALNPLARIFRSVGIDTLKSSVNTLDEQRSRLNPLAACFIQKRTQTLDKSENPLDATPSICDVETPDLSLMKSPELESEASAWDISSKTGSSSSHDVTHSSANSLCPVLGDYNVTDSTIGNVSVPDEKDDPQAILKELKGKNLERPVIAHLNINSISSKFEPLTSMIQENVDILLVTESRIDDTFPMGQFQVEGFSRPIRLDRNRDGGGIIIFVREDLTCNELKPRVLYPELECTFLEMRIRQSKWLVVVGYNPQKENISKFLNRISEEMDKLLPKYENLLMLGDWNSTVNEESLANFCEM